MISDEERRKIAARLRKIKDTREGCGHELCCDLWNAIFDSGYRCTALCDECEVSVLDDVADLIEPSVDRDALLELADEMYELCGPWHDCGEHYARRIREALGVES